MGGNVREGVVLQFLEILTPGCGDGAADLPHLALIVLLEGETFISKQHIELLYTHAVANTSHIHTHAPTRQAP